MGLDQMILTVVNSIWTYVVLLIAVILAFIWSRQ